MKKRTNFAIITAALILTIGAIIVSSNLSGPKIVATPANPDVNLKTYVAPESADNNGGTIGLILAAVVGTFILTFFVTKNLVKKSLLKKTPFSPLQRKLLVKSAELLKEIHKVPPEKERSEYILTQVVIIEEYIAERSVFYIEFYNLLIVLTKELIHNQYDGTVYIVRMSELLDQLDMTAKNLNNFVAGNEP